MANEATTIWKIRLPEAADKLPEIDESASSGDAITATFAFTSEYVGDVLLLKIDDDAHLQIWVKATGPGNVVG